jgi:hypothetical protein
MNFITGTSIICRQKISDDAGIVFEDASSSLETFLAGAYDAFKSGYPKFYKMDRLSQLGFLASEVLLKNWPIKSYPGESVALVLSNAQSSLDTDMRFHESIAVGASPALFVYTLPNIVAGEICIRHGIKGENAFFVTPYFDPQMISSYVDQVLRQPHNQACVAGWIDVMNGHHDVFLYLAEKEKRGLGLEHTPNKLTTLYDGIWKS